MSISATVELPSDDKRWKLVRATMQRNGFRSDSLIEALHTVQETFGYLDKEALIFVANSLNVAPSQVYGVATFYHFFNMRPKGKHVCSVCTGTACHIKGADKLIDHMKEKYDLSPDSTTEDGQISLLTVRCIGACGLAPAVVFDNEVAANVGVKELDERIEGFMKS